LNFRFDLSPFKYFCHVKILVYTILFAVLFSLFARLQVYINYIINQKYYAEVLCENKQVKDSCCHGKCAMEKELVNLSQEEEEQPAGSENAVIKFSKVEEALCHSQKLFIGTRLISLINTPFAGKPVNREIAPAFKPPCA